MAVRQVRRTFEARRVPLIGLAAAFIFAAQMLNFPVAGGTSGHLIGATLAAVTLGPSAAVLVMFSVLVLQCLLFADGGVTALGANLFNMALVATFSGYVVFRLTSTLLGGSLRARLTGVAFASWCSTVVASVACAGELALSGTARWNIVFPAMAGVHALIGLGEALITTLVVSVIHGLRPELLEELVPARTKAGYGHLLAYGLIVSAGLVIFVAPFASAWPDGLEHVAEALGFSGKVLNQAPLPSPAPDYLIPGLSAPVLSTIVAGLMGTLVVFALSYLIARLLTPKRQSVDPPPGV